MKWLTSFALASILPAAAAAMTPGHARACSCATPHVSWSSPADDAVDVPTDVVPILRGSFDAFEFERDDGTPVDFRERAGTEDNLTCLRNVELSPSEPLEPDTKYVIRAKGAASESDVELHFTTGAGPSEERELSPPELELELIENDEEVRSCEDMARGCVRLTSDDVVELLFLRGTAELARKFVTGPDLIPALAVAPDCVEARVRDSAGRRSEPTRRCGNELKIHHVRADAYWVAECEDGMLVADLTPPGTTAGATDPDDGCSVAVSGSGSWAQSMLVLAALCAAQAIRRRRLSARRA